MKLLGSLLACAMAYDKSLWLEAPEGGYGRASCDCEIKCTEEKISQTCGADIVIGIDMQTFNEAKQKLATNFIKHMADQLDVNLGFDQTTMNSARLAVFGFADSSKQVRTPITFDQNGQINMMEVAPHVLEPNGSETNIDRWLYSGAKTDLQLGFDTADSQFVPRSDQILEQLRKYEFDDKTSEIFILLTDGKAENRGMPQFGSKKRKVVTVSFNQLDGPQCNKQPGSCPDTELLESIGNVVIDGKLGEAVAAREIMEMIGNNKCEFAGKCAPCNCECQFPRGPAGEQGPPGCQGQRGQCGLPGNMGKSGISGVPGEPGQQGPKGDCGPCGIPGLPGSAGPPGPPGVEGVDGFDGNVGKQGPDGPPGDKGDTGVKGFAGVAGQEGRQGPDGPPGEQGTKGSVGVPGDVIINIDNTNQLVQGGGRSRRSTDLSEDIVAALNEINLGDVVSRWKRQNNVGQNLADANAEFRDLENDQVDPAAEASREAKLAEQRAAQIARNQAEFQAYNKYLEEYYGDETLKKMSTSVRGVIQEWMMINSDVIDCLLNCGFCGGDEGPPMEGKMAPPEVATLKCEEPVDVVFMVDGSDSVTASDWTKVLKWTNSLIDSIAPQDREFPSTAVFQQFSKDPITQAIPEPIIGTFKPGDDAAIDQFKDNVINANQAAQGTNTYEALNIFFKDGGAFDNLPSVKGTELEDGSVKTGAPVLIVLSDGESRDRLTQRDQYIVDKIQQNARLQIAVGVGESFNRDELKDFAPKEENILQYDDYSQLAEAGNQIIALVQAGCKSEKSGRDAMSNSNYDPRIAEYNPEGEEYLSISQAEYSSESMSMSSSNPSSSSTADLVDPDIDFLEWPYYQRNDKRH